MAGGKRRPRKDKELKVSTGQSVKIGQILVRGVPHYKAGVNVKGMGNLCALSEGTVYFTKRKASHGRFCTFINIKAKPEKAS
jgi:ribosomal protein L27